MGVANTESMADMAAVTGGIDGTSPKDRSSRHDQAGSIVVITIPAVDPCHAVRPAAFKGSVRGIQKVGTGNVGQGSSTMMARLLGQIVGHIVDNKHVTILGGARLVPHKVMIATTVVVGMMRGPGTLIKSTHYREDSGRNRELEQHSVGRIHILSLS